MSIMHGQCVVEHGRIDEGVRVQITALRSARTSRSSIILTSSTCTSPPETYLNLLSGVKRREGSLNNVVYGFRRKEWCKQKEGKQEGTIDGRSTQDVTQNGHYEQRQSPRLRFPTGHRSFPSSPSSSYSLIIRSSSLFPASGRSLTVGRTLIHRVLFRGPLSPGRPPSRRLPHTPSIFAPSSWRGWD